MEVIKRKLAKFKSLSKTYISGRSSGPSPCSGEWEGSGWWLWCRAGAPTRAASWSSPSPPPRWAWACRPSWRSERWSLWSGSSSSLSPWTTNFYWSSLALRAQQSQHWILFQTRILFDCKIFDNFLQISLCSQFLPPPVLSVSLDSGVVLLRTEIGESWSDQQDSQEEFGDNFWGGKYSFNCWTEIIFIYPPHIQFGGVLLDCQQL